MHAVAMGERVPMSNPRSIACAAALVASAALTHARPAPPDYGHDFVSIGASGNRAALESERVFGASFAGFANLGAVNYEYRIARTEVTVSQWLPFVEAFTPYWDSIGGSRLNSYFRSELLLPANGNPNAPPGWTMSPGSPDRPVTFGVRMAAYYCNWLHNGRPLGTWANPVDFSVFLSGAYDASTFTQNPDLTYNDQVTRSEGALYWIPSLDEWTKAAHYDPNRYGDGQEGYWTSQGGQNDPLTSGLPGQGQTSAGSNFPQGFDPRSIPVGSYPDVMSPRGLLDTSGGVQEWTEEPTYNIPGGLPGFFRGRIVRGSFAGLGSSYVERDMIDSWSGGSVGGGIAGFRIASAIPGPGSGLVLGLCVLPTSRRRAPSLA